jgi:hypothetical protein
LGFEEVFVFVGAAEIAGVEPGSLGRGSGEWRVVSGEWGVVSGEWGVVSGEWGGGGCAVGDGGGALNFER